MVQVAILKQIVENVEKVIVGKRREIELTLITLACRGHVLIEDVPGVGKTSLASAIAKSINSSFKRIQFTPDVMPADITGFSMFNPQTNEFEYKPGAILSQIVLADEINRTSPKTQSSLLEVMEEKQVTVDGETYRIRDPFIVLATQNPVEHLGTYPLPEAQMDRFLMRLSLGYPEKEQEAKMLYNFQGKSPLSKLSPVATGEEIISIQKKVETIHVDPRVAEYIVGIIRNTRENSYASLGCSPRASIALFKASQAWAWYNARNYVLPDDVIAMSQHVLAHRIVLTQEAKLKQVKQQDVIRMAVDSQPVPIAK